MDLSIIIVNWNSKDYLQKCIASIVSWTSGVDYEIVVIDSASYDGAGKMLKRYYPQVRFIQSDKNLGFAKMSNAAYSASKGSYILYLNPDTELIGPAINILLDYIRILPNPGAIGCKLLNADGSTQTSCIQAFPTILNQLFDSEFFRALFPKSPLWGMALLFNSKDEPSEVDVISGACLMLRRSVFEEVQHFSEDYFMYAEDVDICYKIKQAGYTNYYIPSTSVIHYGGGSTEKRPSDFSIVMMRESIWRFLKKFRGKSYGLAYRASMAISALGRLLLMIALLPLQYFGKSGPARNATIIKWWAILMWSLGFKATVLNRS